MRELGGKNRCSVCDEEKEISPGAICKDCLDDLNSMHSSNQNRKYATFWHAEGKFQKPMEVYAVRTWANEMQRIDSLASICEIEPNRNANAFPDVFANMNGKCIAIEVTELVDEGAIGIFQQPPQANILYGKYGSPPVNENERRELQEEADRDVQDAPKGSMWREPARWDLEKFQKYLEKRVQKKEEQAREWDTKENTIRSLDKLILLIVTGEHNLCEEALEKYLKKIKLSRTQYFHAVYMMGGHVPDDGEGHYPVFEVCLSDSHE